MGRGPNIEQAIRDVRALAKVETRDDDAVSLTQISTEGSLARAFAIKVKTKDGEVQLDVIAKSDRRFGPHDGSLADADRILVRFRGVWSDRHRDKTRNIPQRRDGTFNEETLLRAINEQIQLAKDDLQWRVDFKRASEEKAKAEQDARTRIEDAYPGTLGRDARGELYGFGHIEVAGSHYQARRPDVSVTVGGDGRVGLELCYLCVEDALLILERLTQPWCCDDQPEPDTRRAHERFPEQFEEVPGEPGTFRYVGGQLDKIRARRENEEKSQA